MGFRDKLGAALDRPQVQNIIIGVILFNAVLLGLETSETVMQRWGGLILTLDMVCLGIFVAEIAAKLVARGLRFFKSGWNMFDFVIVGIALVPAAQGLTVLRALRILRVLRVISAAPRLRRVVEGFVTALPGMGSVFLLMAIIFYIGAVMATKLFGAAFPEWFGTLGLSAYSLFQIMTLESWSMGIVRPVMAAFPYAWCFFIPFIMVTTFMALNLFVGIIVDAIGTVRLSDGHDDNPATQTDIAALKEEVAALRKALEQRH